MKTSNYVIGGYLLILVTVISCKKPKSDDPTPINPLALAAEKSPYLTLANYFNKEVNKQLFTLPASTASVRVKCSQGTVLTFNRSAMLDANNAPISVLADVRIEVQEYLDAKDIVLYGKNTNAGDSLLSSQGLLNIKLKDGNGNTLHFATIANALVVEFPQKTFPLPSSDFYLGTADSQNLLNCILQPNGRNAFTKKTDLIDGGIFYTHSLPNASNWIQCGYPKPTDVSFAKNLQITFDEPKLIGQQKLVYAYSAELNAAYISVTTANTVTLSKLPQGYNFKLITLSIINNYMYADVQPWNNTGSQQLSPRSITDAAYTLKIRAL